MIQGPQQIFSPAHIRAHQARARHIPGDRFLWQEAAGGIADRLTPVNQKFAHGRYIGSVADSLNSFAGSWTQTGFDETEKLEDTTKTNLAVSLLCLHRINDLPGALSQIRQSLQPDGLFLGALFGGETLHELREALEAGDTAAGQQPCQRVAPFADVSALGNLMKRAGFSDAVADNERTTVHYGDISTLITDLRAMGETGILAQTAPLSRTALSAALAHYADHNRNAAGKYSATFDIIYLTGWVQKRPEKIVIPR